MEGMGDAAGSLSCTHVVCAACARGLIEHSSAPRCPTCRAPWCDAASSLVRAAVSGDAEELTRALAAGVDPSGIAMARALVEAVRSGRLDSAIALLVHGADVDASVAGGAAPSGGRERAIDVAVGRGDLAMVHVLIEAGADVEHLKTSFNA